MKVLIEALKKKPVKKWMPKQTTTNDERHRAVHDICHMTYRGDSARILCAYKNLYILQIGTCHVVIGNKGIMV